MIRDGGALSLLLLGGCGGGEAAEMAKVCGERLTGRDVERDSIGGHLSLGHLKVKVSI